MRLAESEFGLCVSGANGIAICVLVTHQLVLIGVLTTKLEESGLPNASHRKVAERYSTCMPSLCFLIFRV